MVLFLNIIYVVSKMEKELKEAIDEVIKVEGECRGVSIESPLKYVELNYGDKEAGRVELFLENFDIPGRDSVKSLKKYPLGYMTATHLAIKELLNWTDKDIEKMGYALPQLSFIVRTLSRYFISAERTFQETPNYWKKHFTAGNLVPVEIDTDKKYLIIRIENYKTHPVDCHLFVGYFSRMISYTVRSKKVTGEERRCVHENGEAHEFYIRWE